MKEKQEKEKSLEGKNSELKKWVILRKALLLSMKVKGTWSILVSLLGCIFAILPVLTANILARLTNEVFLVSRGMETIQTALNSLFILGLLFLLQQSYQALAGYMLDKDIVNTNIYIKECLLRCFCEIKYQYLENDQGFKNRVEFAQNGAGEKVAECVQKLISMLQELILFFSVIIALWQIQPVIVVLLLVTGIPAAILSYLQADEDFYWRAKWMEEGHLVVHYFLLCSTDRAVQDLRHYELYHYLKGRWRALADEYCYKKNSLIKKHVRYNMGADVLRSGVYLAVLLLTARKIYCHPELGIGLFTAVYTLSGNMQQVTASLFNGVMQFSVNISYMQEYFSLNELEKEPEEMVYGETLYNTDLQDNSKESLVKEQNLDGEEGKQEEPYRKKSADAREIKFSHVSFSYPGTDREVLHDISVCIRPGEKVAIVGENGSGKSTFIHLLCGLYTANKGEILVGGVSVEENVQKIRSDISVVFQDFGQYEATLRDNICISNYNRKRSDHEILELANRANAMDVISSQPNGLDEVLGHLGEHAKKLSGGQWQKVSLMRALYRSQAKIMILDEPTAALDPIAEAKLYEDFAAITKNKTTLLISHRLGITALADRILVFRDGRICENGTHEELMKNKKYYHQMYEAQAKWYQNV